MSDDIKLNKFDDYTLYSPTDIHKNFTFTIIMAIYNTEEYLEKSINSIIFQSLDFQEHTQLILVDDGSTDNSLDVALEFQKKYPKNILVISQENQGQASARNKGLEYAKGEYINFLDSDDYLTGNTLKEVKEFFEVHNLCIDVVTIKIIEFDRSNKGHPLNFRFNADRVISLEYEPLNPQLSVSTAFIKHSAIRNRRFKTNLVSSEDTNMINKILLDKKAYGILKSPVYYYRKRLDNSSSIDTNLSKKEYYIDRLKYHFLNLIEYCFSKEGKIPLFIQYTLAYNIQWMVTPTMPKFDSKEEKNEFIRLFNEVLSYISVEALASKKLIRSDSLRYYLISKRNNELHIDFNSNDNEVYIRSKHRQLDKLSNHKLWMDIIEFKNNHLNISGSFNSMFNSANISVSALKTDKNNKTEIFMGNYSKYTVRKDIMFFSEKFQYKYNFDVSIPIKDHEEASIKIKVNYHENGDKSDFSQGNVISSFLKIDFRNHCSISRTCNYFINNSKIIYFENDTIRIENYSYIKSLRYERATLKRIKKKELPNYSKTRKIRGVTTALRPAYSLKNRNKKIFLFMDRINKADDNAEHLFRYANKQNDNVIKYYVISKDCDDYNRLTKEFDNIIPFGSPKHEKLYLTADKIISSNPDEKTLNPFSVNDELESYANSIRIPKYYIRHGVTQGDMSGWLRRFDKNVSLLLTSSEYEKDSFLKEGYNFDESIIQVLGLPRFDNLKNENLKKQILIIPTWRNYLKDNEKLFVNSPYFKSLNELLSDEELIDIAETYGYEIKFKLHPNLENTIGDSNKKYIDLFNISEKITVSSDEPYQKLFAESSLMITDFSSVFFDFGYLKKPIIYYQPNDDHSFKDGYFDYYEMGFGDVSKNINDLKQKIKYCLEHKCEMVEIYKERVDDFFKYTDKNNCKRVYDWIKKN